MTNKAAPYKVEPKETTVESLAQKLFNEAGYQGNVYKADPVRLRYFEAKAIEIIEGENVNRE